MSIKSEFRRASQNSCLGQAQIAGENIHLDLPFGMSTLEGDPNAVFIHLYAKNLHSKTFNELKAHATRTLTTRIPENLGKIHRIEIINEPERHFSQVLAVVTPQKGVELSQLYSACQPIYHQFVEGNFGQPTRTQQFMQGLSRLRQFFGGPVPKPQ